jgi:hypothetical protein
MSMFSRTVVVLALLGAGVHFFRKDLQKLARVLQKPAENFVKEVKRELDTTPSGQGAAAASKAADAISGLVGGAPAAAEKARVAEAAAREIQQQQQQPAPQPPAPGAGAPGGDAQLR